MSTSIIKRVVGVIAALALALGISAVTAGPAEAASKTVWDKVAKCESGGRWHINTGNGYYGGLQFSGSTWKAHGGKKYASKAHKASKAEQIAIARRVLASQGPRAWPSCGKKAHLTKKNGKASKKATPSSNPGAKKSARRRPLRRRRRRRRRPRKRPRPRSRRPARPARPSSSRSSAETRCPRSRSATTSRVAGKALEAQQEQAEEPEQPRRSAFGSKIKK